MKICWLLESFKRNCLSLSDSPQIYWWNRTCHIQFGWDKNFRHCIISKKLFQLSSDPTWCLQWPTRLIRLSNENGVFSPFLLQFGVFSLKVGGALWQRAAVCPWCPCKKWQFYGGKRIPLLLWPLHHPIPTPPYITTSPVFPFWLWSCWGESSLVRNPPPPPCTNAQRCNKIWDATKFTLALKNEWMNESA